MVGRIHITSFSILTWFPGFIVYLVIISNVCFNALLSVTQKQTVPLKLFILYLLFLMPKSIDIPEQINGVTLEI